MSGISKHLRSVYLSDDEQDSLESLVDREGLAIVVSALEGICQGKAEHLRSNWQDDDQAFYWDSAAEKLCDVYNYLTATEEDRVIFTKE